MNAPAIKTPVMLTLLLCAIAIVCSVVALSVESIYDKETANWTSQAIGQDIANLIIFPLIALAAIGARRGSLPAHLLWLGGLGFSVYSFAIYSFGIHFGPLFLPYVAVFGLSVYALILGALALDFAAVSERPIETSTRRFAGSLLIAIGVLFYFLWLSEIVPAAFGGDVPDALRDVALPTNPVHVIDLALVLPAAIIAGVQLLRSNPLGAALAPAMLTMFTGLSIGIITLAIVTNVRDGDPVAGVIVFVGALTIAQIVALTRLLGLNRSRHRSRPVRSAVA